MKLIVDRDGRRRTWYEIAEIEALAASTLADAGLWPALGSCEIDIESLVETHLGAAVDYSADLEPTILGYTSFETPPRVVVNRVLTIAASREGASLAAIGRWRATIAHEAAHILLHGALYAQGNERPGRPLLHPIRCSRTAVALGRAAPDWREVQANMGMAALLMPAAIFDREVSLLIEAMGPLIPPIDARLADAQRIVTHSSAAFRVSRQAASIRAMERGFLHSP